ncbi:hypothetical protein GOODEAATRI_006695 [Goodea atripinnis]|uniref:Uncharacterized protein n=1 Tax=Goodea atripinnis TaxID=208336 RepID=A0ABV0MFL3_9TELE
MFTCLLVGLIGMNRVPSSSFTFFLSSFSALNMSLWMSIQSNMELRSPLPSLISTIAWFNKKACFLISCNLMKVLKASSNTSSPESLSAFDETKEQPVSKVFSYRGRHAAEVWVFEGHLQNLSFAAIGQEPGFSKLCTYPMVPSLLGESPGSEVNESQRYTCRESERENLRRFAHKARSAIRDKFSRLATDMPDFLQRAHGGKGQTRPHVRDRTRKPTPEIRTGSRRTPDQRRVSRLLCKSPGFERTLCCHGNLRVGQKGQIGIRNSSSVYCHVAKKTYNHNNLDLWTTSVKARGLVVFKSVRFPCASALTETFVAYVMKGDCVKMENDCVLYFTMCPCYKLAVGDLVLYVDRDIHVDDIGQWSDEWSASYSMRSKCRVGH